MTPVRWVVIVEGGSDRTFLHALLRRLGIADVAIEPIGGSVSSLQNVATQIRRQADGGMHVALLPDANTRPEKRRRDVDREVRRLGIPVSRVFLLSGAKQPGDLETVLEGLAVARHRVIYDCFEQYEQCVRGHSHEYSLPNRKAKVYAYCEAVGAQTDPEKRDYGNVEHWDLDAGILEPLKEFVLSLGYE